MSTTSSRRVLLIGLDPHAVPGVDAAMVDTAIALGRQGFATHGLAADECLIKPDASAEPELVTHLTRQPYAVIVIGGGLRKPDNMLELLERVIHLIRRHQPDAAIAFNSNPVNSADAALRWLT